MSIVFGQAIQEFLQIYLEFKKTYFCKKFDWADA
jgi:hypothetical protein